MQKLLERNTYTPGNASQVSCSVIMPLNRDESLSEHSLKTSDNNLDVNPPQHREEQKLSVKVYVLGQDNQPLMPCQSRKARILLMKKKAKVIKRNPFTIQLKYKTTNFTQPIILGIDPGYKFIGFSAISNKEELISGEVKLDNMMSRRLQNKSMYRRNKRNRLWYRKPRFLNRGIKKGWLAPSVQRRLDTHINLIKKLKQILPITKINIEVASFDIQKINNPDIEGREYQQGDLYQYSNLKSYLIARENGKCQLCSKKKGNDTWQSHHIISRKEGGTDKSNNFALLHKECHKKLHKQKSFHLLKENKQYKDATFMNIIKWKLKEALNCQITFGYITHQKILNQGLEKSHINDAFVIATGNGQERCVSFDVIQKRKNNRCLQKNRKGFAPSIRRQRYFVQPKDLVQIANKWLETKGCHCNGTRIMINKKSININKIEDVYHVGTLIWRNKKETILCGI